MNGNQNNQIFLNIATQNAMVFRCLAKVLFRNFITSSFIINEFGLFVQESTENECVLVEALLKREDFSQFNIPVFQNDSDVIILGFSTKEMDIALTGITKTDNFKMYILTNDFSVLYIHITNATNGKNSLKTIRLMRTNISKVVSNSYKDHMPTASIASASFKKGITEAKKVLKEAQKARIRAQCGIINNMMVSGAIVTPPENFQIGNFTETWGNYIQGQPDIYDENISISKLSSIGELAPITKAIKLYACDDGRPLKFSLNAGCPTPLGVISVYLKPEDTGTINGEILQ